MLMQEVRKLSVHCVGQAINCPAPLNPDRLALAYHIPLRDHMYVMSFKKKN